MTVKYLNGFLYLRPTKSTNMNSNKSVNLSQVLRFNEMNFYLNKVTTNPNE